MKRNHGSSVDRKGKGKQLRFEQDANGEVEEPVKAGAGPEEGKTQAPEPFIKVRLSHLDYIEVRPSETSPMALRTSPFLPPGAQLQRVPEVRIFGATERGQRILLHVHGVMPYFYIQYDGNLDPDSVNRYIQRLGALLNHATAVSLGRRELNAFDAKTQFVGYIAFCKGVPFYGFHVGYRYFLKIYCLQPRYRKRMAVLLRNGSVMGADPKAGSLDEGRNPKGGFKVFEEHVPPHLQFMLDSNLYGCGWVSLSHCKFRRPLPESAPSAPHSSNGSSTYEEADKPAYTRETVGRDMLASSSLDKTSHCALEADCHVSDITNRRLLSERRLHQDFTEHLENPVPEDQKLVNSVKELWEDERRRRKERGEQGPEDVRGTADSTQRDFGIGEQPEWATERELREQIAKLVDRDRRKRLEKGGPAALSKLNFNDFVKPEGALQRDFVPTAFEAVEAIYPTTWERDEREERPYAVWAINGIGVQARGPAAERPHDLGADLDLGHIRAMGDFDDDDDEPEAPDEGIGFDEVEPQDSDAEHGDEVVSPPEAGPVNGAVAGPSTSINPAAPSSPLHLDHSERFHDEMDIDDPLPPLPAAPPRPPTSASPRKNFFASPKKPPPPPPAPPKAPQTEAQRYLALRNGPYRADSSQDRKRPIEQQVAAFAEPRGGKLPRLFGANAAPAVLQGGGAPAANGDSSAESLRARSDDRSPTDDPDSNAPVPTRLEADDLTCPMIPTAPETPPAPLTYPMIPTAPETPPPEISTASIPKAATRIASSDELKVGQGFSSSGEAMTSSNEPIPNGGPSALAPAGVFQFAAKPPKPESLLPTLKPQRLYRNPFFSKLEDVPRAREYGGREHRLKGTGLLYMDHFEHPAASQFGTMARASTRGLNVRRWEYIHRPPTVEKLRRTSIAGSTKTDKGAPGRLDTNFLLVSQIEGPTQLNSGFKFTQLKGKTTTRIKQHMDVLAIEVFAESRGDLLPNPEQDEIIALFYCLQNENDDLPDNGRREGTYVGIILVCDDPAHPIASFGDGRRMNWGTGLESVIVDVVDSELELLNVLIEKVRLWDPEILTGFEPESWSWGYVTSRVKAQDAQADRGGCPGPLAGFDVVSELGRVKHDTTGRAAGRNDRWGFTHSTTLKVTGRHVLAIWRLLKGDVALTSYTFENVVFHVLRTRVPHYSAATLAGWWKSPFAEHKTRVLRYFLDRVEMDCQLLDDAEIVSRNAEFARVFGVDFFSVITRGSQFKVESVMFRIAKPENLMLPSPTREEVGKQNAAECVPLIMEPESAFYKSPLLVLDFQSLYPSVMIAYNLCYSTCLGRVGSFKGTFKFGTTSLNLPDGLLSLLKDHVFVTPNGFMFVKPHIRKSLLSKMLSEILDTRVMIKKSMKAVTKDRALSKMLNARQLGLKYIANVTYGYTSATFSGRMPAVEIADAIVQSGRETLERAMEMIRLNKDWGAEVRYGDTDSLFVYLPGKTKDDAFRIGNEIADAVTKANPAPVKLKFEKVYLPSFLVAKKRYVGNKFENQGDVEPEFDCKGLEIIRRDGTPALQKLQERCVKEMFRSQDLSIVKEYLLRQFEKMQAGKASIQDFVYAKEVKLGSYSDKVAPPPHAMVATVKMELDPRTEPPYGARTPYVIHRGSKGDRLNNRTVPPETMLSTRDLSVDAEYYISRSFVPALARLFNLVGANVEDWWNKMPKTIRTTKANRMLASSSAAAAAAGGQDKTEESAAAPKFAIDQHFRTDACAVCGNRLSAPGDYGKTRTICANCESDRATSVHTLASRAHHAARRLTHLHDVCTRCTDTPPSDSAAWRCDSLDCPTLFARVRAGWECEDANADERKAAKVERQVLAEREQDGGKRSLVW